MYTIKRKSKNTKVLANVFYASAASMLAISCSPEAATEATPEDVAVETVSDDGDWIRISGSIISTTPTSFVLEYGEENITVEMDDWDPAREGISLLAGDQVTVTGRVDENFFIGSTIEAGAVYLSKYNTIYYASALDEEEFGLAAVPSPSLTDSADYTGWVTNTSESGFTLGAGPTLITVDTSPINTPLAKSGIETGDRIYVWGDLDPAPGGRSVLIAKGLVELRNNETKGQAVAEVKQQDSPDENEIG